MSDDKAVVSPPYPAGLRERGGAPGAGPPRRACDAAEGHRVYVGQARCQPRNVAPLGAPAETDAGARTGLTTDERARIKQLAKENETFAGQTRSERRATCIQPPRRSRSSSPLRVRSVVWIEAGTEEPTGDQFSKVLRGRETPPSGTLGAGAHGLRSLPVQRLIGT